VLAAVDWENLTIPAAFLVGAVMATLATLRIVKHVTNFYASLRRHEGPDGGVPTAEPPPSPSDPSSPPNSSQL